MALSLFLGLSGCGGKQDLNFVGASSSGGTDATGDGGGATVGAHCGDRVVDADEECDDGARADGDGCSGDCTIEDGYTCDGEPSACVKCGNGTIEGTEACDDGNGDDGDGCSAKCAIEGTCDSPIAIPLTKNGDGLAGSITSATGKGEEGQVGAAACQGAKLPVGGGADRIFQVVLPSPADVSVKVGGDFDAIVRVLATACDTKSEAPGTCVDGAAVSGVENLQLDNVPAGTYFIVVDGKAARQAGNFSVDVEARCPLSGLKIDRVILQEPFRTSILNTNPECSIDLSRVGVYAQPEAADSPKTLPAVSLGPLEHRLLTSQSPPPGGTTFQGTIHYELEDYAGAFYLCRGECDSVAGDNVIDAFTWEGASGPVSTDPPSSVTFDAAAPALTDRLQTSYFRTHRDGAFPAFTAADYEPAYFVETFEDGALSGWEAFADIFYDASFEAPAGTVDSYALALAGGNPAAAVWNGPKLRFKDNTGAFMPLQPNYVSLRVRGSDKTITHGQIFFGNAGSEGSGFGSFFRDNGTIGFGPTPAMVAQFLAYQVKTWYLIEYRDFSRAVLPGTAQVYVDGKLKGPINLGAASVSEISIRNLNDTTAWVDQIIVE